MTKRNCDEIQLEFSALLDGELSAEEQAEVEAHLMDCSECLRILHRFQQVDGLYQGLEPQEAPSELEERVRETLFKPTIARLPRPRFERQKTWPLLAAAALLLVMGGLVLTMQFGPGLPGGFDLAGVSETPPARERAYLTESEAAEDDVSVLPEEPAAPEEFAPLREAEPVKPKEFPAPPLADSAEPVEPMAEPVPPRERVMLDEDRAPPPPPVDEPPPSALRRERGVPDEDRAPPPPPVAMEIEPDTAAEPSEPPTALMAVPEPEPRAEPRAEPEPELEFRPGAETRRTVGGRVFVLRDGVWRQSTYVDEPPAFITPESPEWEMVVDAAPELETLARWDAPVVFSVRGTWFRLDPDGQS